MLDQRQFREIWLEVKYAVQIKHTKKNTLIFTDHIMLNVSQFPNGLYFLVVNLGGFKRAFKKFTIVH